MWKKRSGARYRLYREYSTAHAEVNEESIKYHAKNKLPHYPVVSSDPT